MVEVFHKKEILKNPGESWRAYAVNPSFFDFPERVTIELTNRCNLACFMCPRNTVKMKMGDMDVALFKKIIDEVSSYLPVCLVPFFRGESLLHPKFLELLSYAKARGLKPIQLATNAFFLADNLQQGILDLDIDFFSFSVDVNDPEIYRKIRRHSDFQRVYKNIVSFLEKKEAQGKFLPVVQISAVKTVENSDFLKDFIEFWQPKVDQVRIYYAHSLDGRLGDLHEAVQESVRKPCMKVLTDVVVTWNGDVAVCNHDWQRQEFIGNVKDESLATIWRNKVYEMIRQRHLRGELSADPTCKDCKHWMTFYQDKGIVGEVYRKK